MTTGVPVYANHIDWNQDADFSDSGEDVSARTVSAAVRWERGRDQIRALSPPMAGSFSCTLDNSSGDYSPENASSPLYGNVEPGRDLRFRCEYDSVTYPLFRGDIDEPSIDSEGQTLGIRALGILSRLAGQKISSHFYADITTDVAFEHVCRLAGLAVSQYTTLDTGKTVLSAWWCVRDDPFGMLRQILAAEGPGAAIYEDASGVITFHSRHYRLLTTRSKTSQATYSDTGTGSLHVTPYRYNRAAKAIVNQATIVTKVATLAGSATTVWEWSGSIKCVYGTTLRFDIVLDAPGIDFVSALTFSGGGLTTAFMSENDPFAVASGAHVVLLVDNADINRQVSVITAITVTAKVYSSATETVTNRFDTSASQTKHGVRELPSDSTPWPYISSTVARGLADGIAYAYHLPRSQVEVTIENATEADLLSLLAREISDRVTIVDSRSHINGAFFVERLAHEVSEQGTRHRLTLGCERVWSDDLWIYGTSLYGTGRYWF